MNDYYWNEYKSMLLDEGFLIDTLKYQQKTIEKSRREDTLNKWGSILELSDVKFSDTRMKTYCISELSLLFQTLFFEIKKSYQSFLYKVSMPILTLMTSSNGLEPGVYSFDFKNDRLVMCKSDINQLEKLLDNKILLSYFLNIEDAFCLYKKKGYINGIKEIGYVSKKNKINLDLMKNVKIIQEVLPEQALTNRMGINLRKCLLIEYIIFEVIN